MMTKEQAIFFETMDDLNFEGDLEPLLFAYHDFVVGFDFTNVTDIEIHRRAKECLLQHKELLDSPICFYDERHNILETLDLDSAEWEYLDYIRDGMEIPV
ncbi:hypothetical protein ACQCN2_17905 [Brevibacillus ginsengisoli]|uniref:hypothetical protein n=1 Tax=Brevibacillus ginsengisoli TaxID=363854 RepID=UPI003CE6C14C